MASLAARRPAKCHPSLFPATECAHDLLAAPAIIYTSLQVGFRGRFTQTRDVQQQAAEQPTVVDISGLRRNAADAALPIAGTAHATVLFADMRGYTGLAETLPPKVSRKTAPCSHVVVFHHSRRAPAVRISLKQNGRSGWKALCRLRRVKQDFAVL